MASLLTYFKQMSLLCASTASGVLYIWQLLSGSRLNRSPSPAPGLPKEGKKGDN